jgi:hypothetical protein
MAAHSSERAEYNHSLTQCNKHKPITLAKPENLQVLVCCHHSTAESKTNTPVAQKENRNVY